MATPSAKGITMPAKETLSAIFQLLVKRRISTSSATRNRKMMRARFATLLSTGIESVGKMDAWKLGMRIMTEGPSRIPPMTSAMTRGWLR